MGALAGEEGMDSGHSWPQPNPVKGRAALRLPDRLTALLAGGLGDRPHGWTLDPARAVVVGYAS